MRRTLRTAWITALSLILVEGLAGLAAAEISRIGSHVLTGSGGLGEMHADIAFNDKQDVYLAVWGDGGKGGSRPAYAQLVSSSGTLLGGPLLLTPCSGELYGQRPRVAYSSGTSDDVFVVFYREWCSGGVTLWAHIIRSDSGSAVTVTRTAIRTAGTPGGIVYNPVRKEFAVVWEEPATGGFDPKFRAIPLLRNGSGVVTGVGTLGSVISVLTAPEHQGRPDIALDPNTQQYFVVFQGDDPSSSSLALFGRMISAANPEQMSGLLYLVKGGFPVEAAVTYLPSVGRFAVFWRQSGDIVGRLYVPGTGAAEGSIYPVIARPGTDGAATVAYDAGTGTAMVAGMNDDYRTYGSELSASGGLMSTFAASSAPPTIPGGGTLFPQLAATGGGHFGLVYTIDYKNIYTNLFSATGGGAPPPPPPPPPPSTPVITSFTSSVNFPAALNSLVTFTANASGGTAPLEYRFYTFHASTGWVIAQDYSSVNTFAYFPQTGANAVQVWVRSTGSSADYEAYKSSGMFEVTTATPTVTSLTSNVAFPAQGGTQVTFTATVSGGVAPLQYRFYTYHSSTGWVIARDYSPTNSFSYFPLAGTNVVQVWVRNAGSTADWDAYRSTGYFEITAPPPVRITSFTSNVPFPQPVNTAVTFTAQATGGSGSLQYAFHAFNKSTGWTLIQDYSPNNVLTYFPAVGTNAVQVWVRSVGSAAAYDAYQSTGLFTITSVNPPATVSLNASTSFPAKLNTLITFTANAAGGSGDYEYRFISYFNGVWTVLQDYSAWNTFAYFPSVGTNALQVWVRNVGSTADWEAWNTSGYFEITP